ncbi:MAG TPA: nucleotidyltransferase domain-containing protein [Nanoarchaeota archaeon]|nr:nucleotidyltransferase domain-containing protein [Candidatus Pacearchaeota archaeon]HIH17545.1 nucleotidyltransferase domain-containing protein [Nanoarchaeota archaeon]HIH34511.1 nucleotidyltransferase domain-containing protein [Nanoarchaeota archaeon]HIH51516.1 nucleotidyltransferase domain-containing protein [Nanoarchaeota archaeon]HIH66440.1 nucleotidyltransferase domain-containing protein [Nanoarchaeota archaeon]
MGEEVIQTKLNELIVTAKDDEDVLAVALFGSYARGERQARDVDVCLIMKSKSYSNLELSRKGHQYLSKFNFDIHIFQQLPLYIRIRIVKEGKVLFNKSYTELFEIYLRAIKEFGHFEKYYNMYLETFENAR